MNSGPDVRVLGFIAVGVAGLGALLSVTYFFSPLAYLAGLVALVLGAICRTHERSRNLGTAGIGIALLSMGVATAVLVST